MSLHTRTEKLEAEDKELGLKVKIQIEYPAHVAIGELLDLSKKFIKYVQTGNQEELPL